jgi:hypothetical protein
MRLTVHEERKELLINSYQLLEDLKGRRDLLAYPIKFNSTQLNSIQLSSDLSKILLRPCTRVVFTQLTSTSMSHNSFIYTLSEKVQKEESDRTPGNSLP